MKKFWAVTVLSLAFTSVQMAASTSAIAATLFRATLSADQEVIPTPQPQPDPQPQPQPPSSSGNGTTNLPTVQSLAGLLTPSSNGSTPIGFAELVLNDAETALSYTIDFFGLDFNALANKSPGVPTAPANAVTQLHIHNAPRGTNGPVIFNIGSLVSRNFDDEDLLIAIDAVTGKTKVSGVWETTDTRPLSPALVSVLKAGNLYFNAHTVQFPAGAIRGQIERIDASVPEPTSVIGLTLVGGSVLLLRRRHKVTN